MNIYQRVGDDWHSLNLRIRAIQIKFFPFDSEHQIKLEYSGDLSDIEYPIEYRIELFEGSYGYFNPESLEYNDDDERITVVGHVLYETE